MHRWRSVLLLLWTVAILAPLTGTPGLVAADQLSATGGGDETGDANVKGRAVFTSAAGDAHTCRYGEAVLVPANSRSREIVLSFFGATTEGHIRESNYRDLMQQVGSGATHAECDAEGHFEFRNVNTGPYFILGRTLWFNRWARDGRTLMRSINVTDATENDVLLGYEENP